MSGNYFVVVDTELVVVCAVLVLSKWPAGLTSAPAVVVV